MKIEVASTKTQKELFARDAAEAEGRAETLTVAVLVDSIAAGYGGPSYSVRRLWQSASNSGVRITVHSTNSFETRETAEDLALWRPLDCRQWPAVGIKALGYSRAMVRGVENVLATGSSVISQHGLWRHYGRVARKIGATKSAPVIIHPHGMLEPWALARSRRRKQIVGRLWEYENLRLAACLRVTSEAELKSVRAFGLKNPVALVPNGIDVEYYASLPSKRDAESLLPGLREKRVLLFLSRLHPKKGLPLLLKVWHALGSERRDWLLAIAGPDQAGHAGELKQLADELGLGRSIIFTGALFGAEKLAAYALADLFVLPSHSENFGVAVAEALAAGLSVVTTKATPWQKVEEIGCGWWIEADEKSLAKTLGEALALSKTELVEMGARGREWMKRDFAWERLASEMIEVCEWTLARGAPPSCVALD